MLETNSQSRVLATIVFTDAVGFSARMGADEHRTVVNIKRDLAYIAEQCALYEGRVIKNTGDGLLMQFGSAGRAIECAMVVQTAFSKAAETRPAEDCLQHRIGIHLGDVVIAESDVLGDGVNIAARILAQAEPGGICFSQTVYEVVKNRLAIKATFLGPRELKNIRESVPLYQILVAAAAHQTLGEGDPLEILSSIALPNNIASRKKGRWAIAGVAALVGLIIVGAIVLLKRPGGTSDPTRSTNAVATVTAGNDVNASSLTEPKATAAQNVPPTVEPTPAEQIAALVADLKAHNPGFDDTVTPFFDENHIVGLWFKSERVSDLAPVGRLKYLRKLKMLGPSTTLSDLSPLNGLGLVELTLDGNSSVTDLTPLKGMSLTLFRADATRIANLSPLAGMPLENLSVWNWRGWDLEPLRKMPLKLLNVGGNGQAMDLSPLAGAPLTFLCINISKVSDLGALNGAPLKTFMCENTLVSDLSPLAKSPIEELTITKCRVTDLSPISALPLTMLKVDFQPGRDAQILRSIKSLRRINDKLAVEFWKGVDPQ